MTDISNYPGYTSTDAWPAQSGTQRQGSGLIADIAMIAAMFAVAAAAAHVLATRWAVPPGMAAAAGVALLIVSAALHWRIIVKSSKAALPAWHLRRQPAPKSRVTRKRAAISAAQAPGAAAEVNPPAVPPGRETDNAVEPSGLALEILAKVAVTATMSTVPGHAPPVLPLEIMPHERALASLAVSGGRSGQPFHTVLPELGAALASAPDEETELQRVDRLVRRLADSVNRAEAAASPPVIPSRHSHGSADQAADGQLAASIGALRAGLVPNGAPPKPATEPVPQFAPVPEVAAVPDPAFAESNQLVLDLTNALAALPQRPLTKFQREAGHGVVFQRDAILSALNAQRIDVHLEPILELAGQRPQHYEVSIGLRGASGQLINLADAATDLSGTGLLPLIDSTRISRAVDLARRLASRGKTGSVLTGLSSETLQDNDFQATFTADGRAGAFPGQMVLTLPQAQVGLFTAADWQTLARLRAAGFAFALTGVTSLEMDFAGLAAAGFGFARLDAEVFINGLPVAGDVVPPADICRHLAAAGLTLIVGAISDDQQLARIFGFGALFGQGQLFGGARLVAAPASIPIQSGAAGATH